MSAGNVEHIAYRGIERLGKRTGQIGAIPSLNTVRRYDDAPRAEASEHRSILRSDRRAACSARSDVGFHGSDLRCSGFGMRTAAGHGVSEKWSFDIVAVVHHRK